MYSLVFPSASNKIQFSERIAQIANRAWTGYNSNDMIWRLKYYKNLCEARHVISMFGILEYFDELKHIVEDCAFVTILPLKPDIARLHLAGKLSQYDFSSDHLRIHTANAKLQSYHYFQSLFLEAHHRRSKLAIEHLREIILKLLKNQNCAVGHRPYIIYAETSLTKGREIALNRGLVETGGKSRDGHRFYLFDSEAIGSNKSGLANILNELHC